MVEEHGRMRNVCYHVPANSARYYITWPSVSWVDLGSSAGNQDIFTTQSPYRVHAVSSRMGLLHNHGQVLRIVLMEAGARATPSCWNHGWLMRKQTSWVHVRWSSTAITRQWIYYNCQHILSACQTHSSTPVDGSRSSTCVFVDESCPKQPSE